MIIRLVTIAMTIEAAFFHRPQGDGLRFSSLFPILLESLLTHLYSYLDHTHTLSVYIITCCNESRNFFDSHRFDGNCWELI